MFKRLDPRWQLSPEWRFAITAFFVVRVTLSLWSLAVYSIFPVALQNLDFFGQPLLTVFDLRTGERRVFSRQVDHAVLSFHVLDRAHALDDQTGSIWSLNSGVSVQGMYSGMSLEDFHALTETLFPYLGIPPAKNVLLSLWQRFDTNWYLKIATRGYDGSDGSTVYFPAYPILIRLLSLAVAPMFAATLISNAALVGVLVLSYRLVSELADDTTARRALIYLLIFPTSFFLTAAYTESLFLFFTLGCLYSASRRQWNWSPVLGALAALTRLQGVLVIVPLAYMLWRERRDSSRMQLFLRALSLAVIPLATLSFLAYSSLSLFDTYEGTLHARFVFPWENIQAAVSLLAGGGGDIVDILNLLATLGLLAAMPAVWKKLPREYALYSLSMLFAPLFRMTVTQPLVSMTRYALAVFPVFIVLAMWGRSPWVNRLVVYASALLQLYLSAQFILWGWVA